jgi:hypothetical protein
MPSGSDILSYNCCVVNQFFIFILSSFQSQWWT